MKKLQRIGLLLLVIASLSPFSSGSEWVAFACTTFDAFGAEIPCDNPAASDASMSANSTNNPSSANYVNQMDAASDKASSSSSSSSSPTSPGSKLSTTDFKFNPRDISPSRKVYAKGNTESSNNGNVKDFLYRLSQVLLVVVSTGAVLFITIGGFLMATSAGDSEKANKGKIIVTYNIIALAIAMLSYGIIQFVIWILWTAS